MVKNIAVSKLNLNKKSNSHLGQNLQKYNELKQTIQLCFVKLKVKTFLEREPVPVDQKMPEVENIPSVVSVGSVSAPTPSKYITNLFKLYGYLRYSYALNLNLRVTMFPLVTWQQPHFLYYRPVTKRNLCFIGLRAYSVDIGIPIQTYICLKKLDLQLNYGVKDTMQ